MHLRTSPHFQMVGIFYQLALVAKHTGLEHDFVETVVAEPKLDYLAYDHDLEVVWVKDMATSRVKQPTSAVGISTQRRNERTY